MITLYAYPRMFGLPDNNPFGLKVDTFMRLAKLKYDIKNIIDTSEAPRGQLPYITDGNEIISDSNLIIKYLTRKYKLTLDGQLIEAHKKLQFLITRTLDNHLYWIISYSRWQDEKYWPSFKAEFLKETPQLTEGILEQARKYNIEKYHFQGIGRYERDYVYESGIEDLKCINNLLNDNAFLFGGDIHSIDACCYGFLANIVYFDINTPLKTFILEETSLKQYTDRVRVLLDY